MTGDQSRTLNVGDRVCWKTDRNDQGTVTEKNWAGVTIKWDNRREQSILHNDMAEVFAVSNKLLRCAGGLLAGALIGGLASNAYEYGPGYFLATDPAMATMAVMRPLTTATHPPTLVMDIADGYRRADYQGYYIARITNVRITFRVFTGVVAGRRQSAKASIFSKIGGNQIVRAPAPANVHLGRGGTYQITVGFRTRSENPTRRGGHLVEFASMHLRL